jgi:lathosterol oxidase
MGRVSAIRTPFLLWLVDFTEWAVPGAFVAYGGAKYGAVWFRSLARCFAAAEALFLATCCLMQAIGFVCGARRCQGPESHDYFAGALGAETATKTKTKTNTATKTTMTAASRSDSEEDRRMVLRELRQSTTCMFVVACMASFPVMAHTEGLYPTGLTWSLSDLPRGAPGGLLSDPMVAYAFSFLVGIFAADLWTYTKHRALHSKWLYAFHRSHHYFKDPTAFAGFAIHPVETIWTFAPIFLWTYLPHYLPLFAPAVCFFFLLTAYLHCGYAFKFAEFLLPRVLINSSAFHNLHHEKVITNFGEISSFWDYVCGTSNIYANGLAAGYRWHIERSNGKQQQQDHSD